MMDSSKYEYLKSKPFYQLNLCDNDEVLVWVESFDRVADQLAMNKARRVYIESTLKTLLAELKEKAFQSDRSLYKSDVAQERYARQQPEYKHMLEDLKSATYYEEKFRGTREAMSMQMNVWRTNAASMRASMGNYSATT